MSSPSEMQPLPTIPTSSDPALLTTIRHCHTLFSRFVKCSKRAMTDAKSSPEYEALMSAAAAAASSPPDAAKFKRRADNVLIMAMVRECGYVRTPLKDCIAEHACAAERATRDVYMASRPDLTPDQVHAATEDGRQGQVVRGASTEQQRAFAEVAELERGINECVRRYQFAMNVSWDAKTQSFDPKRLDEVKVEVVRPGQM